MSCVSVGLFPNSVMVEVKAYEKWVTKVMSCVSVGLFPNSVGLELRNLTQQYRP